MNTLYGKVLEFVVNFNIESILYFNEYNDVHILRIAGCWWFGFAVWVLVGVY